ncbi:hypothetical protein IJS77_01020 [bacterium]|nr:hypothetical protein [bacterium]
MINKNKKNFYIGLSMGSNSANETGVAILDRNFKIISLDKLHSMSDIEHYFDILPSKNDSIICASIPENPTMLNGKWKLMSSAYQLMRSNEHLLNNDKWADRFSTRGCDCYNKMKAEGVEIYRYDLYDLKTFLGLNSLYKDRTPADFKHLQSYIRYEFDLDDLPQNLLPVSELEAILGAYLSYVISNGDRNKDYCKKFEFKGIDVIGLKKIRKMYGENIKITL